MSAQHTPGPWVFEQQPYSSSSYYIRGHDLRTGRTMTWGKGAVAHIPRSTVMPMEANARLIAAAPDLLDALQGMLAIVSDSLGVAGYHLNGDTAGWDEFDEVDAAREAIAKATGQEGGAR